MWYASWKVRNATAPRRVLSATGKSRADHRVELDTTRLVAEVEALGPHGLELEVEFEFEHGGVGAARRTDGSAT